MGCVKNLILSRILNQIDYSGKFRSRPDPVRNTDKILVCKGIEYKYLVDDCLSWSIVAGLGSGRIQDFIGAGRIQPLWWKNRTIIVRHFYKDSEFVALILDAAIMKYGTECTL
jgi:hypothetical protein